MKKWWNKKENIYSIIGFTIIIAIYFSFIILIPKTPIMFSPGLGIELPTDCSDQTIKNLWDSVFQESSSEIVILTNETITGGYCDNYFAYKIKDTTFILNGGSGTIISGENENSLGGFYLINANFTQSQIDLILGITEIRGSFSEIIFPTTIETTVFERGSPLLLENANQTFESIFKEELGEWNNTNFLNGIPSFYFENTYEDATEYISTKSFLNINYSYNFLFFLKGNPPLIPNCTSNWTEITENCESDDTYIIHYNDLNSCQNPTNIPENKTIDCDYDGNGIIGGKNGFDDRNIELDLYINNILANNSKEYNSTKTISFKEGNKTIVEFSYDFNNSSLNTREIMIKVQPSSYSVGYTIVNGINISKEIKVDKKNSSSQKVCVKKDHIENINSLSENCDESKEYLVSCPGQINSIICNITNNTFIVKGVTNSAVLEFISSGSDDCTPSWNCTDWSACIGGSQIRVCMDSNNCGTNLSKPLETQTCIFSPTCLSSWNCTNWKPETCPKSEEQTRTCADLNSCGTTSGRPSLTQTCEYKNFWKYFIISIILLFLILGTAVLIIFIKRRRQNAQETNQISQQPPSQTPSQPPVFQKRNWAYR